MRAHKQIVVTDGKLGHRGVEASGCMLEPKTGWRGEISYSTAGTRYTLE